MQNDIAAIKKGLEDTQKKLSELYFAMVGSKIGNDRGLVGRIERYEIKIESLEEEVRLLKNKAKKGEDYVKWLWGLGGIIGSGIINEVIKIILNQ